MRKHKRRLLTYAGKDRMSNLPPHLIGSILERLPFQDAVRTSILSKNWRYKWTTMTVLVLDAQLSKKFAKTGAFGSNGFITMINHVLMLHNGPISKFSLHIPGIYSDSFQEVDQTMLLISRKSVRKLVLTNSNRCYELPSYVSACSELRKLVLENCIFKPLLKFEVFSNLELLSLQNIDFGVNSCGALVTLPQLSELWLLTCKNVYNFNIKASKLNLLNVLMCHDAMLLRYLDSPCLDVAILYFLEPIKAFVRVERMNLVMLSSNLPKIKVLYIDGHFMKFDGVFALFQQDTISRSPQFLSADEIPKWLPRAANSLSHLKLENFRLSDLDQLHGALCLLRNSPNLENLKMVWTQMEPQVKHYNVGPASNHLESPDCLDQTLNRLQTVEIESLKGSRPELLFIKILLAHSPSLKKMTILPSETSYANQRLNIAMDVLRFPRASTKAEVIFLNPKP